MVRDIGPEEPTARIPNYDSVYVDFYVSTDGGEVVQFLDLVGFENVYCC